MIRGIRGATTTPNNKKEDIIQATTELLEEMIAKNSVQPEDVVNIWFTVTDDLNAVFPAQAMRDFSGWQYVPVMCATEIPVPGSLRKCIRVMMTVHTNIDQSRVNHIYLHEAKKLRPDLSH